MLLLHTSLGFACDVLMSAARPAQCRLHTHPAKPNTAPTSTTSAGGTFKASTSENPTMPAVCHFSCYNVISKQINVFLMLMYVLHVQDGHAMIANQPFQAKACSVALISLLPCKAAESHTDAHSRCRKWTVCMDLQAKLKHSCSN